MLKLVQGLFLTLMMSLCIAGEIGEPLQAEKAFVFSTYVDEHNHIIFQWDIAPGYYLYQTKFKFSLSPTSNLKVGKIEWPKNEIKTDPDGVSYPIYAGLLKLSIPFEGSFQGPITLKITYQGCSTEGFCYAPEEKYLNINLASLQPLQDLTSQLTVKSNTKSFISDQDLASRIFFNHNIFFTLFSFLGLGLLLAFTPCILPMIPILSGIIVGHQKKVTSFYAFSLSLAYVLGMAITYSIAGILVASLGNSIQAIFQKPWILFLFSGIFVLLSLSLFGLYDLQLPTAWQNHTTRLSNRLKSGSFFSVFLMGCLSTLIVSPCVSAPLVGVLTYIAQTGNLFLGGTALFMLGLGMGIPLLVIGTSAAKWLPKAGHWMDLVKKLFGVLMLGVAIWIISRVIPGPVTLFLWSLLVLGVGIYLGIFYTDLPPGKTLVRSLGILCIVYGFILLIGALRGNSDPLRPWDGWHKPSIKFYENPFFTLIHNETELNNQLLKAKKNKQAVILDFYATWCTACVLMDKYLFKSTKVQKALADFSRLRVDITENTDEEKEILKRYRVIAPPTMLFFNINGNEVVSQRIIGEVSESELLNNIREQTRAK